MKISELTEIQKQHLAFRLDNNTSMGYIGACQVARIELGDDEIVDVFRKAGKSEHSAKILAKKVETFRAPERHNYRIEVEIKFEDVLKYGPEKVLERAVNYKLPMYQSIIADHAKIWKQDVEQSVAQDAGPQPAARS